MQLEKIINNIKVYDVPVKCYYPIAFKDKMSSDFYSRFKYNNVDYTVGNFVILNGEVDVEVAKILCIFVSQLKKVELVVRKYKFVKNVRKALLLNGWKIFEDSEVIEDLTKDYIVQAENILRKCYVIFADEDDSQVIMENNLDPSIYFFCRYGLKSDGLFPILSTPCTVLTENNLKSPVRKCISAKKPKPGSENINTSTKNGDVAICKDPYRNLKASTPDSTLSSPLQRNSVKRNLNESFGTCDEANNSVLSYSIVSDKEPENPLLLKLRISESNKKPFVFIHKMNDTNSPNYKGEEQSEVTPLRKSKRHTQRKSYAEYISPTKSTPRKRNLRSFSNREDSSEESSDENNKNIVLKIKGKLTTPKKPRNSMLETRLEKRTLRTPKSYPDGTSGISPEKFSSDSSVRRSLRVTCVTREVNQEAKDDNRKKREKSISSDANDEDIDKERTPRKKINLDECFRRSILKVHLNQALLGDKAGRKYNAVIEDDSYSSDSETSAEIINKDRISSKSPSAPKRKAKKESLDAEFLNLKTPKSNRMPKSNRRPTSRCSTKDTPKTPTNRAKLIKDGIITPSIQNRSNVIIGNTTPLMKARSQLHVSYLPQALPCRGEEHNAILNFLEGKLLDGCGGCIYISGVPGTGKTATVSSVISSLQQSNDIPKFNYVSINGMRLTEPKQSYVEILKQLTGKTLPWEQAQSILEERFTKSKKGLPVIMLVDELDILYTKRQDVVYNLLDWPTKAKNQLIVITIANTMDLPERLLISRVASRLGLTRVTFQAYTHKQLQEIVKNRLSGNECFNPDAIQFVARKVASVSGDARRALDICRRAAEIAESEDNSQLVNMSHVNKALSAMITQPKVRAIKNCSKLEQLILQSIVAEVERTGVEETNLADVFKMLISCAAIEGFKMISVTNAFSAISRLSACKLILSDAKCNNITQKLILNVSVDDVYYALKKDQD